MNDPAELFSILESPNVHDGEEVKQLVQSLANIKDPNTLNWLVDYYLSTRSQRCLDVLVAIREPCDKHLFDKLLDLLKGKLRLETLKLITNIVQKQPPWLHHITSHKILSHILGVIKGDQEPTHIKMACVIVISLMPMLPVQYGISALQDTLEAFSSLAALCTRKPSHIYETHLLYLKLGLETLYQHLYGMYPCNFLAYLRGYYGSQDHSHENFAIYTKTIRPMLQRTRLHPLLVTASKDAELNPSRWKKMQTYDILAECAKHRVDTRERMPEADAPSPPPMMADNSIGTFPLPLPTELVKGDHAGSSLISTQPYWTPAETCGVGMPRPPTAREFERSLVHEKSFDGQDVSIPLDLAVEATPEDTTSQQGHIKPAASVDSHGMLKEDVALSEIVSKTQQGSSDEGPAERTGSPQVVASGETPFFSTTNNLTAEPHNSVSELPEYQEEQRVQGRCGASSLAQSMSKLRYLSQCQSQCPLTCCGRAPLERSRSCPKLEPFWHDRDDPKDIPTPKLEKAKDPHSGVASPPKVARAGGDGPRQRTIVQAPDPSYRSLLPHHGSGDASYLSLSEMPPGELLEKHLRLVSDGFIQLLQSTGGRGVPEQQLEEVHCLRGQIALLYTELLYERHRKNVHVEHNRRLLAKAKKIVALEEQTSAYKEQVALLEVENQQCKDDMEKAMGTARREKLHLEETLKVLGNRIAELSMKNEALAEDNSEMKEQMCQLQSELAELKEEVATKASELLATSLELETARSHAAVSRSFQLQVAALERELVTLGEMYKRLEARMDASAPHCTLDQELAFVQESAHLEISSMKHIMDVKSAQLDDLAGKIKQLEGTLSNKEHQIAELKQMLERIALCHQEQIQSKEDRISVLTNMCQRMEAHLIEVRNVADQKRESCSEASGGYDDICASMDLDGASSTVDPTGLLGSYTSTTEMTPVSDMLREAEERGSDSPERPLSPLMDEELIGQDQEAHISGIPDSPR